MTWYWTGSRYPGIQLTNVNKEAKTQTGRLDILWSVNKLPRAVNNWTEACDTRLARLISYIHHTVVWETQHNNADVDCFKILILQETLKTQNEHQVHVCAFQKPNMCQ